MEACPFPLPVPGICSLSLSLSHSYSHSISLFSSLHSHPDIILPSNALMFCSIFPQSNALPSHVKITVSRQTLFEDSFQQVRESFYHSTVLVQTDTIQHIQKWLSSVVTHHGLHWWFISVLLFQTFPLLYIQQYMCVLADLESVFSVS